jgi:hypothetical protein
MMLDSSGLEEVSLKIYEQFWIGFMYMYGEILHVNMSYTEESEKKTKDTFDYIAGINALPQN